MGRRFTTTAMAGLATGLSACGMLAVNPPPPSENDDQDTVEVIDSGAEVCGREAPMILVGDVVDVSAAQEPRASTLEVRFTEVADSDGALHRAEYQIFIDDTIDGRIDPEAVPLIHVVESSEVECSVFETSESFLLPIEVHREQLPERCTDYEVALSVVDGDGNASDVVFVAVTTPADGGLPCE